MLHEPRMFWEGSEYQPLSCETALKRWVVGACVSLMLLVSWLPLKLPCLSLFVTATMCQGQFGSQGSQTARLGCCSQWGARRRTAGNRGIQELGQVQSLLCCPEAYGTAGLAAFVCTRKGFNIFNCSHHLVLYQSHNPS